MGWLEAQQTQENQPDTEAFTLQEGVAAIRGSHIGNSLFPSSIDLPHCFRASISHLNIGANAANLSLISC